MSARARSTPSRQLRNGLVEQRARPARVARLEVVVRCVDGPAERLGSRIGRGQATSLLEQLRGFARRAPGARQPRRFVERGRDVRVRPDGGECEVAGALLRIADASRERRMDVAALRRPGGAVGSGGEQRVREANASADDRDELGFDGRSERRRGVATRDGADQLEGGIGERGCDEQRGSRVLRHRRHAGDDELVQRIRNAHGSLRGWPRSSARASSNAKNGLPCAVSCTVRSVGRGRTRPSRSCSSRCSSGRLRPSTASRAEPGQSPLR